MHPNATHDTGIVFLNYKSCFRKQKTNVLNVKKGIGTINYFTSQCKESKKQLNVLPTHKMAGIDKESLTKCL